MSEGSLFILINLEYGYGKKELENIDSRSTMGEQNCSTSAFITIKLKKIKNDRNCRDFLATVFFFFGKHGKWGLY